MAAQVDQKPDLENARKKCEELRIIIKSGTVKGAELSKLEDAKVAATDYGKALHDYLKLLLDSLAQSDTSSEELRAITNNLLLGLESALKAP